MDTVLNSKILAHRNPHKITYFINQIIKALSVLLGVLFGVSERNRWLLKGILSGIFFALISFGIFSLLGAKMSWGGFLGDLGLSIISAVLGSLLAAGRK